MVRVAAMVCLIGAMGASSAVFAAARKKPAAPAASGGATSGAMDTNAVSMHVWAMVALYDMDLSDAQLATLKQMAAGCAENRTRTAPKNAIKIVGMLNDLRAALRKKDEDKISSLRESAKALVDDGDVELDDQPHVTESARLKTLPAVKLLTAGQIAWYLAERSDAIEDPAAWMLQTLVEIREYNAEDATDEIHTASEQIAALVAGLDATRSKKLSEQIAAWLASHQHLKVDEYTAQENALRESAKRVVGDTPAMQVLSNWLNTEMARLLSNPHLPAAIDETRAAKKS